MRAFGARLPMVRTTRATLRSISTSLRSSLSLPLEFRFRSRHGDPFGSRTASRRQVKIILEKKLESLAPMPKVTRSVVSESASSWGGRLSVVNLCS